MAGDSSDSRANQTLKHAAGMAAAAGAYKGLQLVWKQATGQAPPQGPDDQEAPLGRAIAWTLVMGAAITTARMIAVRYTSRLLPGGRKQGMTETAAAAIPDNPVRGLLSRYCMTSVRCRGSRGMPDLVVLGPYGIIWIEVKTFSLGAPFGLSALPVRLAPRLRASSHAPLPRCGQARAPSLDLPERSAQQPGKTPDSPASPGCWPGKTNLRITRVFSCAARGFKARPGFMFTGSCRW